MATENNNPTTPETQENAAPAVNTAFTKLKELNVPEDLANKIINDLGVESAEELPLLTEANLVSVGMKPIRATSLLNSLKPAVAPSAPAAPVSTVSSAVNIDLLPLVPDGGSWLQSLKAGGVLKVEQSTVIGAIRAGLAEKVGMFAIPSKLVNAMEKFADDNEEPADPLLHQMRKKLTRRSYADLFEAIEGLDGSYVTDARKKIFLDRMDKFFWPAIFSFQEQLKSWYETYRVQTNDVGNIVQALAGGMSGRGFVSDIQIPDTGVLHDQADAVANAVNKAFAGSGIQISAAMAYDANEIRKVIMEETRLPALIGAANRDQMLKQLGVAVNPTYPRLEVNLVRYTLAIFQLKDQPSGLDEVDYIKALWSLGNQITWDQLSGASANTVSNLGGRSSSRF